MTTDQTELETLRDEVKEQAATAVGLRDIIRDLRKRNDQMRALVAEHIAKALASRDHDRWHAAHALAAAFDEAQCNVYGAIDRQLAEEGWDPRSAWKALTSCDARCGTRDPWEPTDDVTADDPFAAAEKALAREPWGPGVTRDQAMANVVTLHLAEALLDGKSEAVRAWARGLAHELKRERIDLLNDIGQHMQRMALGGPTNEIPF